MATVPILVNSGQDHDLWLLHDDITNTWTGVRWSLRTKHLVFFTTGDVKQSLTLNSGASEQLFLVPVPLVNKASTKDGVVRPYPSIPVAVGVSTG